jgi:glutathione S-transferase
MKLVFTPNPDYIHKVLVVAHEAGVTDRLTFERTRPFEENTTIWRYNPFGKVPVLILDDGEPLFGGLVICEYLDSLSVTGKSVYPAGAARWPALRQMMLGDGMFDATTLLRVEGWRDPAVWNREYMLRERRKIVNALDRMEQEAPDFAAAPFHIGHVCMAGGLSYLDLRNPIREHALEPGDADFDWRAGRPRLAAWYDAVRTRPSLRYKVQVP